MKKLPFKAIKFNNYNDYINIQYRCKPREFKNNRLHILTSIAFIARYLKKYNLTRPVFDIQGPHPDQLLRDEIAILDVGTRDGWVVELFTSLGYSNVVGVELLDEYVEYCKGKGLNVEKNDIHNLTFDNDQFDLVYCRHTLEHTLDPIKAVKEMFRVTKQGGFLYVSLPMEESAKGKHTVAFHSIASIRKTFKVCGCKFKYIYTGKAVNTKIILPEMNEAVFLLQKK